MPFMVLHNCHYALHRNRWESGKAQKALPAGHYQGFRLYYGNLAKMLIHGEVVDPAHYAYFQGGEARLVDGLVGQGYLVAILEHPGFPFVEAEGEVGLETLLVVPNDRLAFGGARSLLATILSGG